MTARTGAAWLLLAALGSWVAAAPPDDEAWRATWATAQARQLSHAATDSDRSPWADRPLFVSIHNQTIRQVIRTTAAGRSVRLSLSNAFGSAPIQIGAAGVSIRRRDATIAWGTPRAVTFSGRGDIAIPRGGEAVSDTVDLEIAPLSELAIDLFLPGDAAQMTIDIHPSALATTYLSSSGNHVGDIVFPVRDRSQSWFLLNRVDVFQPAAGSVVVAIGDSITDGIRSTPNRDARWTDELARRLVSNASTRHVGVVNLGMGGNRLLSDGPPHYGVSLLTRYDREALGIPGVRFVILMAGINDIGLDRAGEQAVVSGYEELVRRTHARGGVQIVGTTLTPFEGAGYYRPEGEATRQAVNRWIRTSGTFDAVVDFDAVLRDPQQPSRLRREYDSGDHLHPNDTGYKAMGAAIELSLFQ